MSYAYVSGQEQEQEPPIALRKIKRRRRFPNAARIGVYIVGLLEEELSRAVLDNHCMVVGYSSVEFPATPNQRQFGSAQAPTSYREVERQHGQVQYGICTTGTRKKPLHGYLVLLLILGGKYEQGVENKHGARERFGQRLFCSKLPKYGCRTAVQ